MHTIHGIDGVNHYYFCIDGVNHDYLCIDGVVCTLIVVCLARRQVSFLSWPPREIAFVGAGAAPTLAHLKRHLSMQFGIPFDDLMVFKYSTRTARWQLLKAGMKSTGKKGNKKSGNYGKIENILLAPYTFRDGDLISVVDMRSLGGGSEGDVSDACDLVFLDRMEDAYERWIISEFEKSQLVYKASANKTGKKRPIVEVSLRFGGDLDFSSDEDNDSS
jgi:hypothetical protein